MKKIYPILLVCLLAIVASCNLKTYKGDPITKARSVEQYSKIKIKGPFDVTIDPSKDGGLTITAPADAMADIETRIENGELILDIKNSGFMSPEIEVVIGNNQLEAVAMSGSGSFSGDLGRVNSLSLVISGSGNLDVAVDAKKLTTIISGSGKINAGGQCEVLVAAVSGSGNINLDKLEARDADVRVSGSGGAKVNASGNLVAVVSGSGSVVYSGNPAQVDRTVSGSGNVTAR